MLSVFLDRDTVDTGDLDFSGLETSSPEWRFYHVTAPEETAERIRDASVVITNKAVLDARLLDDAGRLKLVCVAATGTNNIDLDAARRLGIGVCNVRAYATPSVAQHVFALILALTRKLNEYGRAVREGRWQNAPHFCLLDYPMRELEGLTLGIVGYGELGHAVARIAEAFGMNVLLAQRPGGPSQAGRTPLPDLLRQVDVLSLHCPLTPQTRGLIGADQLALMKPDALLINTARGGIVDEQSLADALRAGNLGGAGVDVLTVEPPSGGNPLLAGDIPNLIVTPHVAWASRESRQRLIDEVAANIQTFLTGEPRNRVV
jgi:glycerate dehydrogenase